MNRLYEKNKLAFALVWIGLYVVLLSLADGASEVIGLQKIITAPLCIVMSAVLLLWMHRKGLMETYGLCRFNGRMKDYLFFLPLALLCTTNLWYGVQMRMSAAETMLYVVSMICVGFLEEVIFRGLLFRAMAADNLKRAILVSGITFGIGHIVNLLNGAEFLPTILQVCYAAAAGLMFTVIFHRSGCLIPCIAAHAAINSLSAFSADRSDAASILTSGVLMAVSLAYAIHIWRKTA